jgi:hypothetical protein
MNFSQLFPMNDKSNDTPYAHLRAIDKCLKFNRNDPDQSRNLVPFDVYIYRKLLDAFN